MNIYRRGGKRSFRKVKGTRLSNIKNRQIAPIERMLRKIGEHQKYKDVKDAPDGGEGEMVCTEEGCEQGGADAEKSAELNDPKLDAKDPLALRVANFISDRRQARQDRLRRRKNRTSKRTTLRVGPMEDPIGYIRNPFARARYRRLQRKIARSEGRELAGGFTG